MKNYVWFSQENKENNEEIRTFKIWISVVGIFILVISPFTGVLYIYEAAASVIMLTASFSLKGRREKDQLDRINFKLDQIAGRDKTLRKLFDLKRREELEENV